MILKSYSLFIGYKELKGVIKKKGDKFILELDEIGEMLPYEYIRHGFRVLKADRKELEALVSGGYETKRLLLRFDY